MVQLVRELLFNVVKHSGGLKAQLRATSSMVDCITITVEDQGIGFDPENLSGAEPAGLGLFSIRERVSIVGGSVEIDSAPGKGTSITVTLPASL
jgi:signal transduction histidine kinase